MPTSHTVDCKAESLHMTDNNDSQDESTDDTEHSNPTREGTDTTDSSNNEIPERLLSGTLVDGDIPDSYDVVDSITGTPFTVFESGIMMTEPKHRDTSLTIHPETVPYNGRVIIDFFYGRPAIYLYTPGEEDVQYIFALPTRNDPHLRPLKYPHKEFPQNKEIVDTD